MLNLQQDNKRLSPESRSGFNLCVRSMRLLRFAGLLFFILIVTFQFTNIRYFDRTKFSEDNLPNGSSKAKISMSDSEKLEVLSYVSDTRFTEVAEEESIGLGEEVGVIRSQKNDTLIVAAKDKETPDLQIERVETSNGSYGTPPSPDQHPEDLPFVEEDAELVYEKTERVEILESGSDRSVDNLSPEVKRVMQVSNSKVLSIFEMMNLLHQTHTSNVSLKLKRPSKVDQELLYARTQIENLQVMDDDPLLHTPLYWNVSMFKRSYELMEKMLKVYIYKEGKRPVLHKPVLKGIYASEGWFMKQLKSSQTFLTRDPRKAHLFYLPFSSKMLQETLYVLGSHSDKNLIEFLKNYLDVISSKYHYWNRTGGSDHFLVACHDWAPSETRQYMANCIRALCNSDVAEGFVFGKDVSLPETTILVPRRPLRALGGKPTSQRKILAFFAGGMHGYVRPLLVQNWGSNRDPDMKIFSEITKSKGKKSYIEYMKSSKYCICPKGYEVNSPRVVEAVFYECVPVIISDNFVPPFFEVLNWESFAVFVLEKDIPELKNILVSIPEERYRQMQMRVKMVQKHFLWHSKPEKFDIFHMILHSIWYNRVFQS